MHETLRVTKSFIPMRRLLPIGNVEARGYKVGEPMTVRKPTEYERGYEEEHADGYVDVPGPTSHDAYEDPAPINPEEEEYCDGL